MTPTDVGRQVAETMTHVFAGVADGNEGIVA